MAGWVGRVFLVVQSAALMTVLHACGAFALEADPWGGLHASTFCPRVCPDCRGPYTYSHSTVATGPRGKKDLRTDVHCQRDEPLRAHGGSLERDERRFGSGWLLFATLYPVWLSVAAAFAVSVVRARRAKPVT